MKFSKILSGLLEETLPDWQDKFLSYKKLKKELKLIYPTEGDKPQKRPRLEGPDTTDGGDCGCSKEVDEEAEQVDQFVRLLRVEINKFNFFFLGKEEDYVIRWKELQDRVAKAKDSNEELMKVGREIVDFHGEMVLLENYSALNYTGLVKILKKYDKRSGSLIRLPFIQKLLQEPFYTTDVLDKLIKECESMLDRIFFINKTPASAYKPTDNDGVCDSKTSAGNRERHPPTVPSELAEIENMKSMYTKLTLKALCVLKEIRSGSSTVNMFSLPPMQSATLKDDWKNVSVLEQAAK